MEINQTIFKHRYTLYIYIIITGIIGWMTHNTNRNFLKKYNLYSIMIIEVIIDVILLVAVISFNFYREPKKLQSHVSKFSHKDYLIFLGFGIWSTITGILGSKLLIHHDVATVRVTDMIISIPIAAIGTYFFLEEKLTKEKIVGLLFVFVGSYLFTK
jgi:drug/metabolite transporter (DMT)-like permease